MYNVKIVSNSTDIDKEKWLEFVYNHPNGNIFQTPQMFEFFLSVDGYEPYVFVALNNENEIIGLLSAVIIKESGITGFFSSRCIIWGGPLLIEGNEIESIANELLKKLNETISKRAIYTEFRNLFNIKNLNNSFVRNYYYFEEHLNIINDLNKTEDEIWNNINSKGRNKIKKAKKEGTRIEILTDKKNLIITYDILNEVYKRTKLPFPKYNFFNIAFEKLNPNYFRVFIAINNGKIIGTRYVLLFKNIVYDWYAGSYASYYDKYPNDLIVWEIFLWGKKNGYKIFDFGGAGKPNVPYGVRDYKLKFGGTLVNYGRYIKINDPIRYNIGKLGLKIWQKLR